MRESSDMNTLLMPIDLTDPLIAFLIESGLEIYKWEEKKFIVMRLDEELPAEFAGATKLQKPTNIMGKWALNLMAKKIRTKK